MIRPELNFANGNNSALSLRTLAELCRRGEVYITVAKTPVEGDLTIHIHFPKPARAPRD